jgi:hypothetical protein
MDRTPSRQFHTFGKEIVKQHDGGERMLPRSDFEDEAGRRSAAKLLSKAEARRIAANIGKSRQISGIDSSADHVRFLGKADIA